MPPRLSIIVPTLNEAANLPELVRRIAAAVGSTRHEILIVDDQSTDDTAAVCATLARTHPVTLISRQPKDGLSGAVLEGLARARGEYLLVMDADLQHPPEKIPDLLAPLEQDRADFVIGSRYVPGATTREGWGALRKLNSRAATLLARPFAGPTRDPMSGFFALRRSTYARGDCLTPLGYKIALELMCKCRVAKDRIAEIPIEFGLRHAGESKLSIKQQFRYLEHLSRLYDFFFPRGSPVLKFLIATAVAWGVGLAVYAAALAKPAADGQVAPPPAIAIAYAAAIITTAVFHLRYTRTQREFIPQKRPWRDFGAIALCEWAAACATAMFASHRVMHVTAAELFLWSFAAATIVRYVLRKELAQDLRGVRKRLTIPRPSEEIPRRKVA
ncbi:MAG TPA: polyprenol monophosphomannose synthase [Tepidisphaeraceae bacterium]|nr:polyprenol monophosphomannose synthase [Tepidisphaeraceae bacterium]